MAGADDDDAIDRWMFSGNRPLVDRVWVGRQCVVEGGRHRAVDDVAQRYRVAMARLLAD